MSCEKYKNLIEKYLDGVLDEVSLGELKAHAKDCLDCRSEFEGCTKVQTVIRESLSSPRAVEQAKDTILSKLTGSRFESAPRALFGRRMAVAASILLAVGFLLGFGLGKTAAVREVVGKAAKVPMQVGRLEGTVLVKHKGSDIWQRLKDESNIYLGDTFHSTAKSVASLEFKDKSTIELKPNSTLTLELYNGETQFHLEHGELAAALNSPHPRFVVSTPHGQVEALGTEFTVSVE